MMEKMPRADFYSEIIGELKKKKVESLTALKRSLSGKYGLKKVPTNIGILLRCSRKEMKQLKSRLLTKPTRTISGVAPIAIMTKPFPCPHGKCSYCPGGVNSPFGHVPQSYTGKEPATLRAIRNHYDPYLQVFNRLEQYALLGHNFDKVELIVMGGTFPSFPAKYQEEFVKYAFKAMNDFSRLFFPGPQFEYLKFKKFFELPTDNLNDQERIKRIQQKLLRLKGRCFLEKEQKKNERAKIRCIALCLETRPDYGKLKEGNWMLALGCTRIELGLQSVYDEVLRKVNRGHGTKETKKSIRQLKDLGFKVAAHYMPGLPLTGHQKDLRGMRKLFDDPDYRPDMLKIYPCMVTKGTKLYEEYRRGKFKPLTTEEAAELIAKFKESVPKYCRIMRVQRDIPSTQIEAGVDRTNLRQIIQQKYAPKCRCIRCREPKEEKINWNKVKIRIMEYAASKGKEFFISAEETEKDLLIGFIRMRFPSQFLLPEITPKSALIRELHVYGTATGIGDEGNVQHRGWGKKLLRGAEEIAKKYGKNKMVIISGVGAREYYRRLGYRREGPYMVKNLIVQSRKKK